jgi:hypothetical protein
MVAVGFPVARFDGSSKADSAREMSPVQSLSSDSNTLLRYREPL